VVALVGIIISTNHVEVVQQMRNIALATVLFTIILLAAGWLVSRLFLLSRDDHWGVLFELPCRNLAIALVVGVSVLGRPDLARFAATLFVIQVVILLGLIYISGRSHAVDRGSQSIE
jgi:predicted Na+-dependent transporter